MPILILAGITGVMGNQILIPLGHEISVLYSEIGGAAIDLVINFYLIPKIGAVGAAIGTLTAESIVLVIQYRYVKALNIKGFLDVKKISLVLALLAGFAVSVWIKFLHIGVFLTLFLSGVLFLMGYIGVLLWFKDTLALEVMKCVLKKLLVITNKKC